jgi:hypothetical protein
MLNILWLNALLSENGFLVTRRQQLFVWCRLRLLHAAAISACDRLVLMSKRLRAEKQGATFHQAGFDSLLSRT